MNWLRKFMYGRYGVDQLNIALLVIGLVFSLISPFFGLYLLSVLSLVAFILCYYRMFSKDFGKRREENEKFLKIYQPIRFKWNKMIGRMKDKKTHKYYKCPRCNKTIRVPKGKGKICITCPICREEFIRKT